MMLCIGFLSFLLLREILEGALLIISLCSFLAYLWVCEVLRLE